MIAALIVALCVHAPPKSSVLGKEKPWWEKLKRGDVVVLQPIPGTAIPLVKNWRLSEAEGRFVRDQVSITLFAEGVKDRRWEEIHKLADRNHLWFAYGSPSIQIVGVRNDPVSQMPVAEVVILPNWDENGRLLDSPVPRTNLPDPYPGTDSFSVPIAYLGRADQPKHPGLGGLPVLVRRPESQPEVDCQEADCAHMEVIPYADTERIQKAVKMRREELQRQMKQELKRMQSTKVRQVP